MQAAADGRNAEADATSSRLAHATTTADAAAKLVEISGGRVAAFIFAINLFDLGGCDKLIKQGYKVENLIEFPGH